MPSWHSSPLPANHSKLGCGHEGQETGNRLWGCGSRTCKDTPLRQAGHMDVLRWLLVGQRTRGEGKGVDQVWDGETQSGGQGNIGSGSGGDKKVGETQNGGRK